jgi:26S proteasome regulatory subunit N11
MQQLLGMGGMGGLGAANVADMQLHDTSETIYISPIALVKMLKHGRAGVPLEVMGLMLGEFIDDYTIKVVDVFAMPQSGTGVSVEAVDPVFQTDMVNMLRQTGRSETVVGWYHSHPGFGPWLSSVDINTQQSFEQLNSRAVAVVVDPVQSVKGKVVLDTFRIINPQTRLLGMEPRQTTSNIGHLHPPSIQAMIHGLNRHYYSINASYRKTPLEEKMLKRYKQKNWMYGFETIDSEKQQKKNEESMKSLLGHVKGFKERLQQEDQLTKEEQVTAFVGKIDPRKQLNHFVTDMLEGNVNDTLGELTNAAVF